eukprot:2277495-Karenia_brevis.AAC.1
MALLYVLRVVWCTASAAGVRVGGGSEMRTYESRVAAADRSGKGLPKLQLLRRMALAFSLCREMPRLW